MFENEKTNKYEASNESNQNKFLLEPILVMLLFSPILLYEKYLSHESSLILQF